MKLFLLILLVLGLGILGHGWYLSSTADDGEKRMSAGFVTLCGIVIVVADVVAMLIWWALT